jgi:hypothetical protein
MFLCNIQGDYMMKQMKAPLIVISVIATPPPHLC